MQPLQVVPADVHKYATGHSVAGEQVRAACSADDSVVAAMPASYGPVGAAFTAAVAEFETMFKTAGGRVSRAYRDMSTNLHTTAGMYATTDKINGAAVGAASGVYPHADDLVGPVRSS